MVLETTLPDIHGLLLFLEMATDSDKSYSNFKKFAKRNPNKAPLKETFEHVKRTIKNQSKIKSKKSSTKELEDVVDKELKDLDEASADNAKDQVPKINGSLDLLDYSALEHHFLIEKPIYSGKDRSSYLAQFESEFNNPYEEEAAKSYAMQDTDTMDEKEAHDKIERIMADAVTGSYGGEVSHKDKERLSKWVTFNPALFRLYQSTSIMPTGNLDFKYI